jgi:hypothetical protein
LSDIDFNARIAENIRGLWEALRSRGNLETPWLQVQRCIAEFSEVLLAALKPNGIDNLANGIDEIKPRWDAEGKELKIGNKVVKRYDSRASQIIKLLDAFEEEHWPNRIYDPLDPGKLKDTVDSLNSGLIGIRFHRADGWVRWELIPMSS